MTTEDKTNFVIYEQATHVHSLRCRVFDLEDRLAKLIRELHATIDLRQEAEQQLRELAITAHKVTGEKSFPGVEITEFTEFKVSKEPRAQIAANLHEVLNGGVNGA